MFLTSKHIVLFIISTHREQIVLFVVDGPYLNTIVGW